MLRFALVLFFLLVPSAVSAATCVDFSRTLSLNSKGTDVSALQQFLRDNAGYTGQVTGNFGPLTRAAVGKWQLQKGIVHNATTPGYGQAGPKTRAALTCMVDFVNRAPALNSTLEQLKAEVVRLLGVLNSLLTSRGLPPVALPTFTDTASTVTRTSEGGGGGGGNPSPTPPPSPSPSPSPLPSPSPAPNPTPPVEPLHASPVHP